MCATRDRGSALTTDTVAIPLVVGDLSETDVGSVSVSVGRLDPFHVSEGVDNITWPTNDPESWDDEYGDKDGITVDEDAGTITFEDRNRVQITEICVGDDPESDAEFDDVNWRNTSEVDDESGDSQAGSTFEVDWDGYGDGDKATVQEGEGKDFNVTVRERGIGDRIAHSSIDFPTRSGSELGINQSSTEIRTNEHGEATGTLEADDDVGEDQAKTAVYASSGDATERLPITVEASDNHISEQPSFIENQQNVTAQGGNNPDEVFFEFDVDDPDQQEYQIELEVEDEGGVSSVGPLPTPESPQSVAEEDGEAAFGNFQTENKLSTIIYLIDSGGTQIGSCTGTTSEADEQIDRC